MAIILLHSSKTMRSAPVLSHQQSPQLAKQADDLANRLKDLSVEEIAKGMALSQAKAETTYTLVQAYDPLRDGTPAIDAFLGDIYSGLQVQSFTLDNRNYANDHLWILSGLYGVLRALDTIQPYRLEMGYKLPAIGSLYAVWGDSLAKLVPNGELIINVSAKEYTKALLPYLTDEVRIITPKFLTVSPKTGEPTFVTVHAKIARGAFARWLIQHQIEDSSKITAFNELGYSFSHQLSTPEEPVFVAKEFKGLGLSVRLTDR